MNKIARCFYCLLSAAILYPASGARGEIYKWVDAEGKVQFSDQPPAQTESEEIRLAPINTYRGVDVEEYQTPDTNGQRGRRPKQVVMYSAPWCGICTRARRFFQAEGIPFQERDIENSRSARREWERMNASGVPVILVGGKRMNGFSEDQFQDFYAK